jgi:hypothetical protein
MELNTNKTVVFTAISKHLFYFRMKISKFVFEKGAVPINPFMNFDYFLGDTLDRDLVREGNNVLAKRADELWVFGAVSDGVLSEIKLYQGMSKPVKYFRIIDTRAIVETSKDDVELEQDVAGFRHEL